MEFSPVLTALIVITGIFGFYMAWNIGANDVANAMGTSVGSRALTYLKAIIVAAIFEFAGALIVGGNVTSTIQSKVIDVEAFKFVEIDLMLGMMSALLASGIWLHYATMRGWPNSTTHTILGGIVGFGLVTGGFGLIKWPMIGKIVLSWVISPIAGGVVAWLVFLVILRRIIQQPDPRQAMMKVVPIIVFVFLFVIIISLFYKGLKNLSIDLPGMTVLLLATAVGLAGAGVTRLILPRAIKSGGLGHSRRPVERVFAVLQVMTACYMAFAHGANDVANAIGPLAAVANVAIGGIEALQQTVPIWVLLIGAVGIVSGLAMLGYKVMATVGHNITGIAPTRGFAAEFGAATTVLVCSKIGLPISTTHTLIGAVVGIGLLRGINSVNLKVISQVVMSWLTTIPAAAILCSLIYFILKGVYSLMVHWGWIAEIVINAN